MRKGNAAKPVTNYNSGSSPEEKNPCLQAARVETLMPDDGILKLENLPFPSGVALEIIILKMENSYGKKVNQKARNSLKEFLKARMKTSPGRSAEEINLQIQEERDSWD